MKLLQEEINKLCDAGKMIYCIDIDGTINSYGTDGIFSCKPRRNVISIFNKKYDEGHYIVYFTGRSLSNKELTEKWMKKYHVKYHEIVFDKPRAHIYIDDGTVDIEHYLRNPYYWDCKFQKKGDAINANCRSWDKK